MTRRPFEIVLTDPAALDLAEILAWSAAEFGAAAAQRYKALVAQALIDLREDPERPGARERVDLLPSGLSTYHLALSRDRVVGAKVKSPRHLILYRIKRPMIEVVRIVHDSRDLERHLPE